jgi:hypothetical protein
MDHTAPATTPTVLPDIVMPDVASQPDLFGGALAIRHDGRYDACYDHAPEDVHLPVVFEDTAQIAFVFDTAPWAGMRAAA